MALYSLTVLMCSLTTAINSVDGSQAYVKFPLVQLCHRMAIILLPLFQHSSLPYTMHTLSYIPTLLLTSPCHSSFPTLNWACISMHYVVPSPMTSFAELTNIEVKVIVKCKNLPGGRA